MVKNYVDLTLSLTTGEDGQAVLQHQANFIAAMKQRIFVKRYSSDMGKTESVQKYKNHDKQDACEFLCDLINEMSSLMPES